MQGVATFGMLPVFLDKTEEEVVALIVDGPTYKEYLKAQLASGRCWVLVVVHMTLQHLA